ncbi:MAG: prepilin-type N-terminal cleavage/methylation domain-containing protein [Rhodoferax sp.]
MITRSKSLRPSAQAGYTLVEVAIVLAAIGLIVGGMSIGKEVLREAEYNRIENKFVQPWKVAYDLYAQRTGSVVGDSQIAPTLMVNGFEAISNSINGSLPGLPQNFSSTGLRICQGQGYAANTVGMGDPGVALQKLHDLFDRTGIRMPAGRAEGQEDRYAYSDTNGNAAEIQICFQWNPDKQISGAGNVMVIRGLTPDLARKLDVSIDGKADALEGRFRQQNSGSNTTQRSVQVPGHEWLANNTYSINGADPTAMMGRGRGESQDEDRVVLMTAHWLMDR